MPWWVWGIGIAGVGYVLYRLANKVPQAINATSSAIANAWLALPVVGLGPGVTILGNVRLPDGSFVPLNNLIGQLRQDKTDPPNTYANVSGMIYQLSPSDAQGNYPAALIGPAPAGA